MNASVLLVKIASEILLPPLSLLLLAALGGMLLTAGYRRAGRVLVILSVSLLAVLSTPVTGGWLAHLLESESPPLSDLSAADAQAIVVLGANRIVAPPEYGGLDQPGPAALVRLRYGAGLHQQTGLPILVSGGSPAGEREPEATLMTRTLRDSFKVPVRWEEGRSNNTAENAMYSAAILHPAGVTRILLVTDAMHMPRARRVFANAGFDVVPAPTRLASAPQPLSVLAFLPQSHILDRSKYALHEMIGILWYRLRYRDLDTSAPTLPAA